MSNSKLELAKRKSERKEKTGSILFIMGVLNAIAGISWLSLKYALWGFIFSGISVAFILSGVWLFILAHDDLKNAINRKQDENQTR